METYIATQFITVTLIMKNVPKQDEQVSLLRIWDYKLKIIMELKGYYT